MRVETDTGLVFDDTDDLCKCILSQAEGQVFAFIQAIDTGHDGSKRYPARYWGAWNHDAPEDAMRRILAWGGKWPALPPAPEGEA